jgi:sec-independent protein translocase protein TatB
MLDVSFTELLVVGVVALVVIGPERLPKVARTLGHLVGRAQRYVNDVKSDIQREVELDEFKKLKDQVQDAAQSVQSSLQNTEASLRNPIESIEKDTMEAFHANGIDSTTGISPTVSASDSASALAQAEAAEPTFHKVAPYVTIGGSGSETAMTGNAQSTSSVVKPYKTIIASPPTQLEIDGVSATAATSTPGSKS